MNNQLSKKHNFFSLLKFALPTMVMMIFMSMYTMVDGIFVSQTIGTSALSAINIVYPLINFVMAIAIMLATGGSAIIAKKMGEQDIIGARQDFSLISIVGVAVGVLFSLISYIFLEPILKTLGANAALYDYCYNYSIFFIAFAPLIVLQMLYQYFFVTAGKPALGLFLTVLGGAANIILDYIFLVPMKMGIEGAAIATIIGVAIPSIAGAIYFSVCRKNTLYYVKPKFSLPTIIETCANGSSEMVTNLSIAVTTFLFNIIMMNYLGENGVAAITIVLYAQFLLIALFLGFSSGVAPIFSYHHGNVSSCEMKNLFKISIKFVCFSSIIVYLASMLLATYIVSIFAPVGSEVFNIALTGFYLFSLSYLFTGVNIFASAMFTALSNGKVSAIISFLRTFVFIVIAVIILPMAFGINGVWLAVPIAEILALAVSLFYFFKLRHTYALC